MKTKIRYRAACIALAALLLTSTAAYATPAVLTEEPQGYYITEPYEYPVLPGTEEWEALPNNLAAKVDACAVPLDTLEHMTTGALLETVLTYPLLDNIFAFNTIEQGIESVSSYFHGINVLREREDAPEAVALMTQAHAYFAAAQNSEELGDEMILRGLRLRTLSNMMTPTIEPMVCPGPGNGELSELLTPMGNPILPMWYHVNRSYESTLTTYQEQESLRDEYLTLYDSIDVLRDLDSSNNASYNCHSFAWYCQEEGNNVWLDNVSEYIYQENKSYLAGTAREGSIILYENKNYADTSNYRFIHSARVVDIGTGGEKTIVVSKWGANCLFQHEVDDCPYSEVGVGTTTISAWNWNPANPGNACPGMEDFLS